MVCVVGLLCRETGIFNLSRYSWSV